MAGLLALLGGLSPNQDGTPNALQRMSNSLHPEQEVQRMQAQALEQKMQQEQAAIQQGQRAQTALQKWVQSGSRDVRKLSEDLAAAGDSSLLMKLAEKGDAANADLVKGEGDLRKEFDGLNKDYRVVQDAYNKINKSANDPSAAGDLALIFSYMKILDPGSTVREGEFANAQNAGSIPVAIQNIWNRAMTGERLQPEQRADFLNQSKNLYEAQAQGYQQGVKKYRGLAMDYGYNPDRIVKPLDEPKVDPLAQKKAELRAKIAAIKKQRGLK